MTRTKPTRRYRADGREPAVRLDAPIVRGAIVDAFRKLDPRVQIRNPVMFVVFVGSIFTTVIGIGAALGASPERRSPGFILARRGLAVAHGAVRELRRGRGRRPRQGAGRDAALDAPARAREEAARAASRDRVPHGRGRRRCVRGDLVLVEAGDMIPADGEVIEGVASVNESAVTGESAPVLREAAATSRR